MYIWVFIVCSLLNLEQCSFCHFWENLRWSQCLGLYFWLHHEVHGMGMFVHLAIQLHQYLLNLWCTPFLLGAPNCIGSSWYKVCYNNNGRHGQHKKKLTINRRLCDFLTHFRLSAKHDIDCIDQQHFWLFGMPSNNIHWDFHRIPTNVRYYGTLWLNLLVVSIAFLASITVDMPQPTPHGLY